MLDIPHEAKVSIFTPSALRSTHTHTHTVSRWPSLSLSLVRALHVQRGPNRKCIGKFSRKCNNFCRFFLPPSIYSRLYLWQRLMHFWLDSPCGLHCVRLTFKWPRRHKYTLTHMLSTARVFCSARVYVCVCGRVFGGLCRIFVFVLFG